MVESAGIGLVEKFEDSNALNTSDTDSTFDKVQSAQWADSEYRKDVQAGDKIGFYELSKCLGTGNFSKVRLGVHSLTEDYVAVKIIEKTRLSEKKQHVIQREVRILNSAHHHNIVRLFEFIVTFNRCYLVLELAQGENLHRLIVKQGALKEATVFTVFAQVVDAVHHLHSKNIVHRDLKAENIVYDGVNERAMLIDFGFSMQVADNELSTNFCGSLPYSSPELLYEKPHHAKPVDMWALGVLLFYMLTGSLPFSGLTPDEMRSNIFRSSYSLPAGIHDKFVKLLAGLLEPNPDLRFTSEKASNLMNTPKQTHVDICHNPDYPNPLVSKIVVETFNYIVNKYGITWKELNDALSSGLNEPLTGIYRMTYLKVSNRMLNYKRRYVDSKVPETNDHSRTLVKRKSRVCTIL